MGGTSVLVQAVRAVRTRIGTILCARLARIAPRISAWRTAEECATIIDYRLAAKRSRSVSLAAEQCARFAVPSTCESTCEADLNLLSLHVLVQACAHAGTQRSTL